MLNIDIIVGGQFGSEGKGAVAGFLAKKTDKLTAIRVAGPNAGHSAKGVLDGKIWALRTVPVMAVTNLSAKLYIAAGSEVELKVLSDEVCELDAAGYKVTERLYIDAQATILEQSHHEIEANKNLKAKLGSTAKGIGAARADRIMRVAKLVKDEKEAVEKFGVVVAGVGHLLDNDGRINENVIIEGTQGFGLGLHSGYYPYCTSSDTRAIDFLAMSGLNNFDTDLVKVTPWVVLRTFPIRVAGNSGPLQNETDWETLGQLSNGHIKPELTTVTKLVRRVGKFDSLLAARAVSANGGRKANVALTFLDYVFPELYEATSPKQLKDQHREYIKNIENEIGAPIVLVGTGPDSMIDLSY